MVWSANLFCDDHTSARRAPPLGTAMLFSGNIDLRRLAFMENQWKAIVFCVVMACTVGCRTFSPTPMDEVGFKQRAEKRTEEGVTVSVVVLTAEEAKAAFDCKLYKKKIQPVWIEITNDTDDEMLFMPRSVDPEYFAPLEVAQKTSWRWSKRPTRRRSGSTTRTRCRSKSRRVRPYPVSSSHQPNPGRSMGAGRGFQRARLGARGVRHRRSRFQG